MDSPANRPADFRHELPHALRARRRSVRQKVHIPAYANLNGSRNGMMLDLNEIIDISEDGICIQTSSPLKPDHDLPVSLDLAETKAFIHTTGHVIWTDKAGRAGVHFPELPPQSRQQLREWLFANAIAACVNHADVKSPLAFSAAKSSPPPLPAAARPARLENENAPDGHLIEAALRQFASAQMEPSAPIDHSALLIGLAAVQKEVEAIAGDQEEALRVIAGCALTFTGATGAAIALHRECLQSDFLLYDSEPEAPGGEMICCAVAGCDAPPLHSRLLVGSGFSGECVRSRKLLSCEDSESDPRVDRDICRALGIRSMVAVPVIRNNSSVGLLEVFSPEPAAFLRNSHFALERLAGMIARVLTPARESAAAPEVADSPPQVVPSAPEVPPGLRFGDLAPARPSNYKHSKVLLIAAVFTLIIVLLWLLMPRGKSKGDARGSQPESGGAAISPAARTSALAVGDLEGIRRLAAQGDVTAQYALGVRYATGDEVKEDYSEAVTWFVKAAEQGSVPAQATLGAYYWAGRGVPQDLKKAYFWAVLAQAGGDQGSRYRTAVLASRLNRSQIIAAQAEANDWIKTHQLAASR
jgi:hypothetical protein